MSRSTRQSKILDIIAGKDVETQEELVAELTTMYMAGEYGFSVDEKKGIIDIFGW